MPVPHDFYSPYSDEPRLHNRHHSRPYIEPDWQAHAAGHQLPVLSTIGRGPRGYGMHLANYSEDGNGYQFDIISDDPNAEPFTVGPIPTGEIEVATEGGKLVLITNEFYVDDNGQRKVKKVRTKVDLPQAEDGTRIFLVKDSDTPRYKTRDDLYQIPRTDLYYYNNQNTQRENAIPEPRVEDLVMFTVYSDEDTMQLEVAYGFFASLDGIDNVLVKAVEYLPTIKGDKGDKGDPGDPGQPGRDGIRVRKCFYMITDPENADGIWPGETKWYELEYIGTITSNDIINNGYEGVIIHEDQNPPLTEDILGVVYSSAIVNVGGTYPVPHVVQADYKLPLYPNPDHWYFTQRHLADKIDMCISETWPRAEMEEPCGICHAYAVITCIDRSGEVEPY